MISKTTINTVKSFCRPALEGGLIEPAQFEEMIEQARQSAKRVNDSEYKKELSRMWTVKELAALLKVSCRTVHRMKKSGRLPGVYLTGSRKSLRFREADVKKLTEGEGIDEQQ